MLSCKKATELIDKKIHHGITRKESVRLHFHTMMCSACTNYQKQGLLIDKAIKDLPKTESGDQNIVKPENGFLDRIIDSIKEQ